MVRQAIDTRLAFGADTSICSRGSEIDGGAGGSNECMAKFVVVEKAVHVGAENTTGRTHGAVGNELRPTVALDVGERMCSAFIKRFTDVDLVAFERNWRRRIVAKKIAAQKASNALHGLLLLEHGTRRQKTERCSAAGHAVVLDTVGIFNGEPKHLKAAANTDNRNADIGEAPNLQSKTALLKPT